MQAQVKEEVSRAVSAFAKMEPDAITWLVPRGNAILECWKTPLGLLFIQERYRGKKKGDDPFEGSTSFYSVFLDGHVEHSCLPFDGTGAEEPQKRIGEIEIDFTADPPTWREV